MKKIFYLASIAALAFSSCAKDETTEVQIGAVNGGSKIVAAMEADDTRTELVKNGNAYDIVWKSTDGLSVYSNDSKYALNNVLFQLDNASDGLASGAFTSQSATLNAESKYVALYPYNSAYDLTPNWEKELKVNSSTTSKYLDYSKIELSIPAEQIYVPGSFNTNTVAAISSNFTVGEDGNATVDMQPVVDYLMVDFVATEDIETIQLQLLDVTSNEFYVLNGTNALDAYALGNDIRYYLTSDVDGGTNEMDGTTVTTLNTKNLAGDVSLAEVNTYVFVVPAGILGTGKQVKAIVHVNDGTNGWTDNVNRFWNTANISYAGTASNPVYRQTESKAKYDLPVLKGNFKLENMVFHMNAKDAAGERVPFVYNPEGDFIIENEVDLFAYLANYSSINADAYVEEGATLNVSKANMDMILKKLDSYVNTSANKNTYSTAYSNIYTVINNYVKVNGDGTFPTIANFAKEFKGNGAVIANIDRPLASANGLFGNINGDAVISDLTLSNIDALAWADRYDTDRDGKTIEKGYILAAEIWGTLKNVTVEGLNGLAIAQSGNVDHFSAIKVGEAGIGEVEHFFGGKLNLQGATAEGGLLMNKKFTISAEAWEALNDVEISVFHEIVPKDTHVVATLPAGADYATFTCGVDNVSEPMWVASVLIDGVSYWTGGVKAPVTVKTWNNGNSTGNTTLDNYMAIQYAEELAYSGTTGAYLVRDINLNGANELNWNTAYWAALNGAGNTISDLAMEVEGAGATGDVAPFGVPSVAAINFDGISIKVVTSTGKAVPEYISGVSNYVTSATSVAINDLSIKAVPAEGNYANVYDNTTNVNIGWLSAKTYDPIMTDVTVNNVKSNVMGIAGLVANVGLTQSNSIFDDCAVTGNNTYAEGQNAMTEFTYYEETNYNVLGSLVGYVYNEQLVDTAIRFDGFVGSKPVFLYEVETGYVINVNYNGVTDVTLENPEDLY